MNRGINTNYNSNKESSLHKYQQTNTHINTMPKGIRQRTVAKVTNTTTEYNLEEMIDYIRQNPNAALDVHNHLTQITHLQHQTPKRNLDTSTKTTACFIKWKTKKFRSY